jgi:twitching motility protein PilT
MVPSTVEKFTKLRKGLVIVTGPTGSGKSTTLAAIIDHINREHNKHIITIEDPIEYKFTSNKSLINQREIGTHSHSFANALRNALRENPDIIMIGELRDLETIQLALTAAETGHLVFCTLHTSSAPKTVDRIIDVFPSGDKPMIRTMLASSLEGIISQTLLARENSSERIAAYEVMLASSAIRNLIRENKLHQISSLMQIGAKQGMILMEQSVKNLYEKSLISEETAKEYITQMQEKEEKKTEGEHVKANSTAFVDNEF